MLGLATGWPPTLEEMLWLWSSFSLLPLLPTSCATDIYWNKQETGRKTMGADNHYLTGNYHEFTFLDSGGDLKHVLTNSLTGFVEYPTGFH